MKKLFRGLTSLLLVGALSCATINPNTSEEERFARAKDAVVHVEYDGASCTAFHVGAHKLITANHCLDVKRKLVDINLIDQQGNTHKANILLQDEENDVAVLYAETFRGPKLELWDEKKDGKLRPGTEIMTIGYPGYYFLRLTFEIGYVRETEFDLLGRELISSRDSVFRGESGGPTLAVKNGKVIGMNDMLIENIDRLSPFAHQHGSISLYVPYNVLADDVKEASSN